MIDAVTMRQGVLVSKLNGQTAACPKERSRDEYMHKAAEELAREAGKQQKARFGVCAASGVDEVLSGKEPSHSRDAAN